jgi:hypothetical protein
MQNKKEEVRMIIQLGGKSVCGSEFRPDSCTDCSELPNCVLDVFYEQLTKMHTKSCQYQKMVGNKKVCQAKHYCDCKEESDITPGTKYCGL